MKYTELQALRAELQPVLDEKARIDDHARQLDALRADNDALLHAYAEMLRRVKALEEQLQRLQIIPTRQG